MFSKIEYIVHILIDIKKSSFHYQLDGKGKMHNIFIKLHHALDSIEKKDFLRTFLENNLMRD